MIDLMDEAKKLEETIIEHRRYLHQYPELGMDLPITTSYVKEKLIEMGYEPKEICDSGIVTTVGGKKPGKTFLLRADMDALPIEETLDLPYKSKTENMHACGHDFHTAMLLGAAEILKKHEDEINGTVKLMFQPGEEIFTGAKTMIENGLLENPKVDAAVMIHVRPGVDAQPGTVIGTSALEGAAASDQFTITVQGKGGHGAMPDTTVDPLNVAAHLHIALQEINAREVHPSEFMVLTVGQIHGGNAANIIPDTATLSGTIRTYKSDIREFVKKRLVEVSNGVASTFRASVDVEFSKGCPSVLNDKELLSDLNEYLYELLGDEGYFNASDFPELHLERMSGSEDFAYISEKVPSVMLRLAVGRLEDGYTYPQHHPMVTFDERALYKGAGVYASVAMEWLRNN